MQLNIFLSDMKYYKLAGPSKQIAPISNENFHR
jgi:hypothetical protein